MCVAHRALDLLALVQPQQAGVDEHAGELVADRAVHERRGDRRIHAARQPADHLRVADERADLRDLLLDERARRPARRRAADLEQEVREQLAAARRVRDLGMELHAVDRLATRARTRRRGLPSLAAVTRKPGGGALDVVAVAHPHRRRLVRRRSRRTARSARVGRISARPYSRCPPRVTSPPSRCAMSCMP